MTLMSAIAGRALGYGPRTTPKIEVVRDIGVPMRDGVTLLADWYRPAGTDRKPVLLVRTPYGRNFIGGLFWARLYAERGYQVLIQSVRGTHGSGGEFRAEAQEHEDGVDTLRWLRAQPWCGEKVATVGPSYLGYVQWALGPDEANTLAAMCPQVTSGKLPFFPGGTVALQDLVGWTSGMAELMKGSFTIKTQLRQAPAAVGKPSAKVVAALEHLPSIEADTVMSDTKFWHWQNWLQHLKPGDEWWESEGGDWQRLAGKFTAPMLMVSGWYDVFLLQQLTDYRAMRDAGLQPYLTVGPWTHGAPAFMKEAGKESMAWFRAHLDGDQSSLRSDPVRIFVTGAKAWRTYPDWPPPADAQRWNLQPLGKLSTEPPTAAGPDAYTYDPARPTPSVGGAHLGRGAGPRKNNELEARDDVLTYTSAPLDRDMEVIGELRAELFVQSSAPYADFFVRLCEVDGSGTSRNVSDGVLRVYPEDTDLSSPAKLEVELWPIAHRFARGSRIRVQVSSGAFPRFARNLGTGEGITSGKTMIVAHQQVLRDPEHPSCIVLPVCG